MKQTLSKVIKIANLLLGLLLAALSIAFCEVIHAAPKLYKKLFPIPEDNFSEDPETIEAEVVDDYEPSGAADEDKEDKKITVIRHQTNVVQNGENNINLTNNGTINFNL